MARLFESLHSEGLHLRQDLGRQSSAAGAPQGPDQHCPTTGGALDYGLGINAPARVQQEGRRQGAKDDGFKGKLSLCLQTSKPLQNDIQVYSISCLVFLAFSIFLQREAQTRNIASNHKASHLINISLIKFS